MFIVTVFLSLIALILNIVATRWVPRSDLYSYRQKRNQIALVWLVPFVGPILILWIGKASGRALSRVSKVANDTAISEQQAIDFGLAADD